MSTMSEQIDQQIPATSSRMTGTQRRDQILVAARRSSPSEGTPRAPTRWRAPPVSRSPTSCGCSARSASCSWRPTGEAAAEIVAALSSVPAGPDAGRQMADAYVGLLEDRNLLRLSMHGFLAGADDEVGRIARHTLGEAFRLFRERTGAGRGRGPPVRRPGHAHQRAARRGRARPRRARTPASTRSSCASRTASPSGAPRDAERDRPGPSGAPPRRTGSSSSTSRPAGRATTWSRGCAGSPAPARSVTRGRSTRWRPGVLVRRRRPGDATADLHRRCGQGVRGDDPARREHDDRRRRGRDARGPRRLRGDRARRSTTGVAALTGDIQQVPSAVSRDQGRRAAGVRPRAGGRGRRARGPARDGLAVRRARRAAVADGAARTSTSTVVVSSGTYVRALARDLGAGLGVGGHLTALRRTRVGGYGLDVGAHAGRAGRRRAGRADRCRLARRLRPGDVPGPRPDRRRVGRPVVRAAALGGRRTRPRRRSPRSRRTAGSSPSSRPGAAPCDPCSSSRRPDPFAASFGRRRVQVAGWARTAATAVRLTGPVGARQELVCSAGTTSRTSLTGSDPRSSRSATSTVSTAGTSAS